MSDLEQQETREQETTFKEPNKSLIKKKSKDMDSDEADLHNEETLEKQSGRSDNHVLVREVLTDPDADPINENLTDQDRNVIAGYNERTYQTEVDKEKYARLGYMIWQSKQLYYTAFRQIGFDSQNGKVIWEQRDYKYHQLMNSQKLKINKLKGDLQTLETKNRLWQMGVVNDALYTDMITRDVAIDTEIAKQKDELLKTKFEFYFLESDRAIMGQINEVDLRDLVEAAEYREQGVPFSRKRASYRYYIRVRSGESKGQILSELAEKESHVSEDIWTVWANLPDISIYFEIFDDFLDFKIYPWDKHGYDQGELYPERKVALRYLNLGMNLYASGPENLPSNMLEFMDEYQPPKYRAPKRYKDTTKPRYNDLRKKVVKGNKPDVKNNTGLSSKEIQGFELRDRKDFKPSDMVVTEQSFVIGKSPRGYDIVRDTSTRSVFFDIPGEDAIGEDFDWKKYASKEDIARQEAAELDKNKKAAKRT